MQEYARSAQHALGVWRTHIIKELTGYGACLAYRVCRCLRLCSESDSRRGGAKDGARKRIRNLGRR
eukprot:15392651-Alexandrium_andersonii.AAC.1